MDECTYDAPVKLQVRRNLRGRLRRVLYWSHPYLRAYMEDLPSRDNRLINIYSLGRGAWFVKIRFKAKIH